MSISVFEINRKIERARANNRPLNIDVNSPAYCINELLQMDVPVEYQDDDFSCTPVCMLMILKYIKGRFTSGFPDLSLSEISEAIKTSADLGGTTFDNIENINELFKKTSPSLEIVPDFRRKFEEIIEEVKKNNRPVIAWILMNDPNGDYEHAIARALLNCLKLLKFGTIFYKRFLDRFIIVGLQYIRLAF